jgi:hypothetical protein
MVCVAGTTSDAEHLVGHYLRVVSRPSAPCLWQVLRFAMLWPSGSLHRGGPHDVRISSVTPGDMVAGAPF